MKKILFHSVVLSCLFLFLPVSCDNHVIGLKDANDQTSQVGTRSDCENCSECCCSITLDEDNAATLHLCGIADGPSPCIANTPSGCFGVDDSGQLVTLTSATVQRHVFCMLEGTTLRIINTSSTDGADIILACQHDSGLPQTVQISLDPLDVIYYDVSTGCIVGVCD